MINERKPLIQVQGVKGLVLHGLDVDLPHVLEAEKDLLNEWPLLSLQLQGDIQLFKRRLECKRAIKLLNYIIGDLDVLRDKYAVTASLEQGQVQQASDATLHGLADLNQLYECRFGFIFIVFATGKSAEAMLALLKQRLNNNRNLELETNALEQNKITLLRLSRLFQVDKMGS